MHASIATPVPSLPGSVPAPRKWELRIIPRIETWPRVVSFVQTTPGKVVLMLLFGIGLRFSGLFWLPLFLWLVLITAMPRNRTILVAMGALVWAFLLPWAASSREALIDTAAVLLLSAVLFSLAVRFSRSMFGRNSLAFLLGGYALCVLLAGYLPKGTQTHIVAWDFLKVMGLYLWFIAYALLDARTQSHNSLIRQLGAARPFWGSTNTPYGKGATYLRRIEARTPEQLAVTQIKGLKLLAWAFVLIGVTIVYNRVVHVYLGIPTFERVFYFSTQRIPYPWFLGWSTLIIAFFQAILSLAIQGHLIIACCRMAGYQALRNTYRPLQARSIAEFWNRYYFYFKELLVDMFFYPVFIRWFKGKPRLRLFAATFAAAFFGNAFYHFFRDLDYIKGLGFWHALTSFHVYLFYCFILALGIGISQLRAKKPIQPGWVRGQLVPAFCVCTFYCCVRIFDTGDRGIPIQEHFRFLAHLFQLVS